MGPPIGHATPWVPPGATSGPPGPPTGPPGFQPAGDDGGGPRRQGRLAAIIAVFAVMVLVIGAVAYTVLDRDDDTDTAERATTTTSSPEPATDESTTTTTEASSETTAAADPVDEAELLAVVRELQDYVEQARQLEFTRDVEVELLDGTAFEDRLLADFEENLDQLEEAEVFYRALALLDDDRSLADHLRQFYAQGVLGFYDTETDELVVRGSQLTPYVRQTIVHELVHAIDDQNFELFRPEYDDRDDEISGTFGAVVEGNARRIDQQWLAEQPEEIQAQVAAEEAEFGEGIDIDNVPYALIFEIAAPYEFGELFVDHIVAGQGERAVNEALTTPPETSEQILFPEVYDRREPAVEVPTPEPEGDPVDEGVLGALLLFGFLTDPETGIDPITATRGVDGWGGDRYVTWKDGDANCVRIDMVGDTDDDTAELRRAVTDWTELRGVGTVSNVDGRVRLESCTVFTEGPASQT